MSLTAGAGTRCMSLLPDSPTLGTKINEREVRFSMPRVAQNNMEHKKIFSLGG